MIMVGCRDKWRQEEEKRGAEKKQTKEEDWRE